MGYGWDIAKDIANENGQYLANSILQLYEECNSHLDIHIIAHSLGARVVLKVLGDLNNTNLKLKSLHLMRAAVDDDVVSKNPSDNPKKNFDNGAVYGKEIENHVVSFYNLFDPEDDRLKDNRTPYTYYPLCEDHLALGNVGIDTKVKPIDRPQNYVDINVQNELPKNVRIDFTDADGDGVCDLPEPVYFGVILERYQCGIQGIGDNHRGYMGFGDKDSGLIVDDGAMDIVAKDWMAN